MTERFQQIARMADLIAADLTGKISDAEREELEQWERASPENRWLRERYRSEIHVVEKFRFVREYDSREAFRDFMRASDTVIRRRRKLTFSRYAAVAALFVVLGVSFYLFRDRPAESRIAMVQKNQHEGVKAILTRPDGSKVDISDTTYLAIVQEEGFASPPPAQGAVVTKTAPRFHTVTIPRGGEYDLTLSDGSRLRMNSESEIRVPEYFDACSREVYMTGEIYFDVARDTAAPFVVYTRGGEIKVLGTSFNVRNYSDEVFLETTLVSGRIAFASEGEDVYLNPGEQLRLNKESGEKTVEEVDVSLYCSWKDGRFVFEQQRLEEIMNTVSRWYNVDVVYEDQPVKELLLTGNIRRYGELEEVVEMLQLINRIEIKVNGNSLSVKSKK